MGAYSLLLIVYKGRTPTILARAFVTSLYIIGDNNQDDIQSNEVPTPDIARTQTSSSKQVHIKTFHFKKEAQDATLENEPIELNYESGGSSLVMMAPYTIGWAIPKALKDVMDTRANILLVSEDSNSDIIRALKTNIDARAGFHFVFIPSDVPLNKLYRIRIEIFGDNRKFVGHTHKFTTKLPAFAQTP